jgi:hypothetical protein
MVHWRTRHARNLAGVVDLDASSPPLTDPNRGVRMRAASPRRGSDGQPASHRPARFERGGRAHRRPALNADRPEGPRSDTYAARPVRGCGGDMLPRCV